jgi:hypothetical protein
MPIPLGPAVYEEQDSCGTGDDKKAAKPQAKPRPEEQQEARPAEPGQDE